MGPSVLLHLDQGCCVVPVWDYAMVEVRHHGEVLPWLLGREIVTLQSEALRRHQSGNPRTCHLRRWISLFHDIRALYTISPLRTRRCRGENPPYG